MNKRRLLLAAGLVFCMAAFLTFSAYSLMVTIENQLLMEDGAQETWEGEEYQLLQKVAARCTPEWKKPRLFIMPGTSDGSPAASLIGSTTPLRLRGGIILISDGFLSRYSRETLVSAYAHELGHLVDDGMLIPAIFRPLPDRDDEQNEYDADDHAVRCLGPDAVIAMYRELAATITSTSVLRALDKRIQRIEANTQDR